MKYTAKTLAEICYKILPRSTAEFNLSKSQIQLPKLIDMCIVKLWVDQIPLSFEEDMILRRAAKELESPGYMSFEKED